MGRTTFVRAPACRPCIARATRRGLTNIVARPLLVGLRYSGDHPGLVHRFRSETTRPASERDLRANRTAASLIE